MNWIAASDSYQSRCVAFFCIRLYFPRFYNMLCTRKGNLGYIYSVEETDSIISTFLSATGN